MMMDERDPGPCWGIVALGCTMEPPLGHTMEALVGHCRVPQDITLAGRTAPHIISGWELRQGSGGCHLWSLQAASLQLSFSLRKAALRGDLIRTKGWA